MSVLRWISLVPVVALSWSGVLSPSAAAQAPAFESTGLAAGDLFGASVARIKDRNGDGFDELVVGAPNASPNGLPNAGELAIIDGLLGVRMLTIPGTVAFQKLGASVLQIADLNGDNRPEIAAGVPGAGGITPSGGVRIFDGQSFAALGTIPGPSLSARLGERLVLLDDVNGDGTVDFAASAPGLQTLAGNETGGVLVINPLNGATIRTLMGSNANDNFGTGLSAIGDLNGDGKRDLLIGTPGFDPPGMVGAGRVAAWDPVTGALIRFQNGPGNGFSYGFSCAAVDDLDFDGVPDVVVGAPGANPGGVQLSGQAFVLSGATFGQVFQASGTTMNDRLGSVVAGLGDIDADGRGDFAIATPFATVLGNTDAGEIRVFSGGLGLLYPFMGTVPNGGVGGFVHSVGDLDQDGRPDFVQGDPLADFAGTNSGRLILRRGQVGHLAIAGTGKFGTPFTLSLQAMPNQSSLLLVDVTGGSFPSPYGAVCLGLTPSFTVLPLGPIPGGGTLSAQGVTPTLPFAFTVFLQAMVSDPFGMNVPFRASSCTTFTMIP